MKSRTEKDLRQIAKISTYLLFSSKQWVNRRVDSLSLSDPTNITRHVSVDITIPEILIKGPRVNGCILIPLAALHKAEMNNFSTHAEGGESWSLYGYRETRMLQFYMLQYWRERCKVWIDDERTWYYDVLDFGTHPSNSHLQAMQKITEAVHGSIPKRKAFLALVKILARDRILFARMEYPTNFSPCRASGKECRILKFTYDRQLLVGGSTFEIKGKTFKQRHTRNFQLVVSAANATYARHYHLELAIPDDLSIVRAMLYDERTGEPISRLQERNATRCDLYEVSGRGVATNKLARGYFMLAPARRSWTHASLSFSALSMLALGAFGVVWIRGIKTQNFEAVFTVLVALAGLLFSTVIQPEESNFSRHLYKSFRKSALFSAAATAAAIVAATVSLTSDHPRVAGFCAALGAVIAFFPSLNMLVSWCGFTAIAGQEAGESELANENISKILQRPGAYYHPSLPVWDKEGEKCGKQIDCFFEQAYFDSRRVRHSIEKLLAKDFGRLVPDGDWWGEIQKASGSDIVWMDSISSICSFCMRATSPPEC